MKSDISIIIPVYKVPENLLRKSIESCINQTLKNIEIVLVDDQSPDNCGKICDEYKLRDKRINVIHQKNKGLSGARNTGVMAAKSKWIMFLDGDDYIDEDMCEVLFNKILENDVDIVCCGYCREDINGRKKICDLNELEEKIYRNNECKILQEKVLNFNSHFATAYCKLIRKKFLIDNNIFHNEELRQGAEGIEFNIRLFEDANKVLIVKKYMYHYMYNKNSISNSQDEKNYIYVIRCFENIKKFIKRSKNYNNLIQIFYNRMIFVIVTTTVSGYFNFENKEKYNLKCSKFKEYLKNDLIKEALDNSSLENVDIQRKIIIYLIKLKCFRIINILSKIKKFL